MIRIASPNIEIQIDNLDRIIRICSVIQFYRYKERNSYPIGAFHDYNLLYQKSLLHGTSIKQLAHMVGQYFPPKNNYIQIIDPFSINIILRSLIEAYLTFHHMSSSTSNEENSAKHMIWVIFGMLQRQKLSLDETNALYADNKNRKEKEREKIDAIISNLKQNDAFLKLDTEKQSTLLKQLKREWKIEFYGNTFQPKSYQDIMNSIGFTNELFANIYNSLSWSTHSTSISISQFNELWGEERHDSLFLKNALVFISSILAFMTYDIIYVDTDYSVGYKKLTDNQKQFLNDYHAFFRE